MVRAVTIRLRNTSNVFPAGSRIRWTVSSRNFRRFDRNPNTGEARRVGTRFVPAHQYVTTRQRTLAADPAGLSRPCRLRQATTTEDSDAAKQQSAEQRQSSGC